MSISLGSNQFRDGLLATGRRNPLPIVASAGMEHLIVKQHEYDPHNERDNIQINDGPVIDCTLGYIVRVKHP